MAKKIEKRFPADTSMLKEIKNEDGSTTYTATFLSDPKVDAELYAYLLSQSIGEEGETRVYKNALPAWKDIATEILHCKSKTTVGNHLKYLKDTGYITDCGAYYRLELPEKMYFKMPLELVEFFTTTIKEQVLKTYIYLGQRNNYKPNQYVFTIQELCEHTGLSYKNKYNVMQNALTVLEKLELIKITRFFDGKSPKMRLVNFSIEAPKS